MNIPTIITAATLTRVKSDFLKFVLYRCRHAIMFVTMPTLEFTNDLSSSILKISMLPENAEPVSTLQRLF